MQFAFVNPFDQTTQLVCCDTLQDAYPMAGFSPAQTDHGIIAPGLGIVVYEFGLFDPVDRQAYFAINGRMYAGNALLYAFDHAGDAVNLLAIPPVIFFPTAQAAERNIALGLIERPVMTVNGVVTWKWPEPRYKPKG